MTNLFTEGQKVKQTSAPAFTHTPEPWLTAFYMQVGEVTHIFSNVGTLNTYSYTVSYGDTERVIAEKYLEAA